MAETMPSVSSVKESWIIAARPPLHRVHAYIGASGATWRTSARTSGAMDLGPRRLTT